VVCEGLASLLEKGPDIDVVGVAYSGKDALRRLEGSGTEVVLMDVSMPEMTGIEATRQILARDPSIRVLALSAYADPRSVNGMLASGAGGYGVKANVHDELYQAIHAVAAGKRYLCSEVMGVVVSELFERPSSPPAEEVLAPREREVLKLIAEGLSSAAVAEKL